MKQFMSVTRVNFYRQMMSVALSILLICMSFSSAFFVASASTLANGKEGTVSWVLTDDGTCTFSGTGAIQIPAGYTEYKDQIKKVVVNKGITSIGVGAFDGFKVLESVNLPEGLKSIGGYSFMQCSSLKNINIPDSVTNISGFAFSGCTSLKKIELPPNLGKNTFASVFVGAGITEITVPDGVKVLGEGAFNYCENLVKVNLPDSIEVIEPAAFDGCTALEEISIPKKVTVIETLLFRGCTALKKLVIPDGVTEIRHYAVNNCTSLESITIPATVTKISDYNFDTCTSLKKIVFLGTKEQWEKIEILEAGNERLFKDIEIVFSDGSSEMPVVSEKDRTIKVCTGMTAKEVIAAMPAGSTVYGKDNNKVNETDIAATGMILSAKDGKEYVIICLGDVSGDGSVTAQDARLTLRASVGLEDYATDSAEYLAANVLSNDGIAAADAREILRASVGLTDSSSWL